MQILNSSTFSILKASFIFAVAFLCASTGVQSVSAQTNYVVDLAGNGCGNNCADFYNYLASQGISISNTTTNNQNNSSNNGSTTGGQISNGQIGQTGYVQYPYYQYTPFPSTDAYYRNNTSSYGSTYSNSRGANSINYVQYPYYQYSYFQNPAPKYDSYLAGTYPENYYVYYGKSASDQLAKYQKPSISNTSGSGFSTTNSSGSGFTITSILK